MRTYQHEVKYYECDRMGITHHSNYVRFMEEARVDWMDQVGWSACTGVPRHSRTWWR